MKLYQIGHFLFSFVTGLLGIFGWGILYLLMKRESWQETEINTDAGLSKSRTNKAWEDTTEHLAGLWCGSIVHVIALYLLLRGSI